MKKQLLILTLTTILVSCNNNRYPDGTHQRYFHVGDTIAFGDYNPFLRDTMVITRVEGEFWEGKILPYKRRTISGSRGLYYGNSKIISCPKK